MPATLPWEQGPPGGSIVVPETRTVRLKPNAAAAFGSGWNAIGQPTLWQALADALQSSYVFSTAENEIMAVRCEPVPGDAVDIIAVTVLMLVGQDSPGLNLARLRVYDTAGGQFVDGDEFAPGDGGYLELAFTVAHAPDGGPWTPAKVSACAIALVNTFAPGGTTSADMALLEVTYTTAALSTSVAPVAILADERPTAEVGCALPSVTVVEDVEMEDVD